MVRDLEREGRKLRNGNRFIKESEGGTGVFSRDVDRLYREYANLRHKIYNDKKHQFRDNETREELRSYINEQFVKLVREYDINSPVDFPGYINRKLKARVNGSFLSKKHRDRKREILTGKDWDLEETLMDLDGVTEAEIISIVDQEGTVLELLEGIDLEDLDLLVLSVWLNGEFDHNQVVSYIMKQHGYKRKEVNHSAKKLSEHLKIQLDTEEKD